MTGPSPLGRKQWPSLLVVSVRPELNGSSLMTAVEFCVSQCVSPEIDTIQSSLARISG